MTDHALTRRATSGQTVSAAVATGVSTPDTDRRFRMTQIAAFAAVYVIWGSTYLAIRLLMETLPGFSMVGLRFVVAGALLFAWARWRGAARPTAAQWRSASIVGTLLLFVGTGAVVWATQFVESGLVALLVATQPLWVAVLMSLMPFARRAGEARPSVFTYGALLVGFAGAAVLAAPGQGEISGLTGGGVHLPSLLAITIGCLSWSWGSLWARKADLPRSPWMNTAIQMLVGGAVLMLYGAAIGEWSQVDPATISGVSILAFLYLVVFGSLVAFSAYSWLVQTTDPTLVTTHAYVNPVVAVFLGWWIADETVTWTTVLAASLIVGAVVLVTADQGRRRRAARAAQSKPAAVSEPEEPALANAEVAEPANRDRLERCA